MLQQLKSDFIKIFGGHENVKAFFAPGRVNLIGEHTDYNGGHVFPCALSVGTYVIARRREDTKVRLYSTNFEEIGVIEVDLEDLAYNEKHDWANYPKGVLKIFKDQGLEIENGFDVLFFGNIPNGAGLSSSASIELATSVMLNTLFDLGVEMVDMVKYSQKAENEYIGVSCGIMDQFAIGMGKTNHAILLDCDTLKYEYSPVELGEATLVIANTNKRRGLADSKYNERRSECERALADLQTELAISSLGDLTITEFEKNKDLIKNEIDRKRAEHAVYENERTKNAVVSLKQGNIKGFGELMNQSHISLRDLYEVTGTELDALVESAWNEEGVIGSRMTGAGFGGCTVSIVENSAVERFIENVGKTYSERTGLQADFYIVSVGNGASEITLS
ncbi:galactokinase [Bacillus sp. PS06]|uniref:galactokinase n=1 Tax=Bacillus sp. PS06 TaxID=2764176 RepID=UPI001785FC68|nr:galactokinase [Bacillus sp. PS06]MBD8070483.1 galactokinase [Bacillus sp. PS06]